MSGRPSDYTPEIDTRICEEIANGKSLRELCRADDMPCRDTVYTWMGKNKAFADRYARAVEDRAEFLAEEILSIADDDSDDIGFKDSDTKDGKSATPFIKIENVNRDRLRVDARKWIASKLFPRKFGDAVRHEGEVSISISDKLKEARDRAASGT